MKAFDDLASAYRQLGPVRFSLIAGGTLAAIVAVAIPLIVLSERLGWPEAYGFSCRRKCLALYMWQSPKLLDGGSRDEVLLFLVIWSIPLMTAGVVITVLLRRWLKRHRARIRPMR
ncbi:MAG: hypothetical protein MUF47_13985 [Porphyrobacter sp.]|nr:hypothetical protein [Porphyrobacter sp.]